MTSASWPEPVVQEIVRRCEARPDRETCGFVLRRGRLLEVVEVPNVAGSAGALAPAGSAPGCSRHAYVMDPAVVLRVHRELAASGGVIAAVWHSHVDGTAALSAQDRADALAGGVEQVPGADYLVAALRRGRVTEVRAYHLVAGEFVQRPSGA